MALQKKLWHVRISVVVIAILLLSITSCVMFIFLEKKNHQNELNAKIIQNEMTQHTLPKYSVQSKLEPTQYLKVNLPQEYFSTSDLGDDLGRKYQNSENESFIVYAILEIDGGKIKLKPYKKQNNDNELGNLISIHIQSLSKTEKKFQLLESKNYIVGYELTHPKFETNHLQAELVGNYAMLLRPINFSNSIYDPFYIRIGRGEKPKSSAMFRDGFSVATMIKNGNYVVKYHVTYSQNFIKLIRRGSPYKQNEATNFLERLFILTSTSNPRQILQFSSSDLESFVRLNNEVIGLIEKNSVVEQIGD